MELRICSTFGVFLLLLCHVFCEDSSTLINSTPDPDTTPDEGNDAGGATSNSGTTVDASTTITQVLTSLTQAASDTAVQTAEPAESNSSDANTDGVDENDDGSSVPNAESNADSAISESVDSTVVGSVTSSSDTSSNSPTMPTMQSTSTSNSDVDHTSANGIDDTTPDSEQSDDEAGITNTNSDTQLDGRSTLAIPDPESDTDNEDSPNPSSNGSINNSSSISTVTARPTTGVASTTSTSAVSSAPLPSTSAQNQQIETTIKPTSLTAASLEPIVTEIAISSKNSGLETNVTDALGVDVTDTSTAAAMEVTDNATESEEPSNPEVSANSSSTELSPNSSRAGSIVPGQCSSSIVELVLSVLVINAFFCAFTTYLVYRVVRKHHFYSWDPPPVRYGSVDYGISMGRRNMGLDISPETHDGIPPPPRITHDRASSNIPITITNEDGWCVPYNEQHRAKEEKHEEEEDEQQHQLKQLNDRNSDQSPINNRAVQAKDDDTGV